MPFGPDFALTAALGVVDALAAMVLVIVVGVRALHRPRDNQNYQTELSEARLLVVLDAGGAVLLGIVLIGLLVTRCRAAHGAEHRDAAGLASSVVAR
jgi:hypothetical protein